MVTSKRLNVGVLEGIRKLKIPSTNQFLNLNLFSTIWDWRKLEKGFIIKTLFLNFIKNLEILGHTSYACVWLCRFFFPLMNMTVFLISLQINTINIA